MAANTWTPVLLIVLAAGSAAATPIVGTWAPGMSAVILLLLVVHLLTGWRGGWRWDRASAPLGLLGGLVAMASTISALVMSDGADSGGRRRLTWLWLVLDPATKLIPAFALAACRREGIAEDDHGSDAAC